MGVSALPFSANAVGTYKNDKQSTHVGTYRTYMYIDKCIKYIIYIHPIQCHVIIKKFFSARQAADLTDILICILYNVYIRNYFFLVKKIDSFTL